MTRFAIQRLREEKKMSQEELANKSGVSRTTISLIETDKSTTVKLTLVISRTMHLMSSMDTGLSATANRLAMQMVRNTCLITSKNSVKFIGKTC